MARRGEPRGKQRTQPDQPAQPEQGELVSGIFQSTMSGIGFVVPDSGGHEDVMIPRSAAGVALHGDHVQAQIGRARPGRQPSGQIVRILRHAHKTLVGRITHHGRYSVVVPKNNKVRRVLEIHRKLDPAQVPDGAWVVAEVRRWSDSPQEPLSGRLVEVLGQDEDQGLPILLLVCDAGVRRGFSEEVEAAAQALLAQEDQPERDPGRRDFRKDRIVTIDPATAKDFDDAVGLIRRSAKGWRVGVHIADVGHYVRPGTPLDEEAYERSTSIYPIDRVIPMLPEALSNQLCSLRPGEDKRTMSALFDIAPDGAVSNVELCESVIRSGLRFAYEEAQALFDEVDRADGQPVPAERKLPPPPAMPKALRADLLELRAAAQALSRARFGRGALDLDLPEPAFEFDEAGRPIALKESERFEAHKLIEELMIAANEAVSRTLEERGYPVLFRVHGGPSDAKAEMLAPVLARVGIPMRGGKLTRQSLQELLDQAHHHPARHVIQRWVLRTMMRAEYHPENIGHFGLASASYAHFTSPIRRYPDLVIHRVVKHLLAGDGPTSDPMRALAAQLPVIGRHTSTREQAAQKIEWDAEEIMALDYMRRFHLGDVFEGYIAGVNAMGFFVSLVEYPVEGLVRIATVEGYYDLDQEYHIWRSRQTGASYAMGDAVSVVIERIDVLAGEMDLVLVRRKTGSRKGSGAAPKGQRRKKKETGAPPVAKIKPTRSRRRRG